MIAVPAIDAAHICVDDTSRNYLTPAVVPCDHVTRKQRRSDAWSDEPWVERARQLVRDLYARQQRMLVRSDSSPPTSACSVCAVFGVASVCLCMLCCCLAREGSEPPEDGWEGCTCLLGRQGVCFGHQLIAHALGGKAGRAGCWGYGSTSVQLKPELEQV